MKAILLCVTYTMKPGTRDDFLQEIRSSGVLSQIRAEEGCLSYAYYLSEEHTDQILLVEKWESEALQQAHLKQPHMRIVQQAKDKYVTVTSVEKAFS